MPDFVFNFVLLDKVKVKSAGIILTLVAHFLISDVTSSESNPNFQYLCDLCLIPYTFWGNHSSTWVWCHSYKALPLARGLTFHVIFTSKTFHVSSEIQVSAIFNPVHNSSTHPIKFPNLIKFLNLIKFPNLLLITSPHRAEAQTRSLLCFYKTSKASSIWGRHPSRGWCEWVTDLVRCCRAPGPRSGAGVPARVRMCRCRTGCSLQEGQTPSAPSRSCSGMFEQERITCSVMARVKFYKESRCACLKDKLFAHAMIR